MRKIPKSVLIISKIYFLTLLVFSLFRLFQFLIHFNSVISDKDFSVSEVASMFLMGIRFDLIITGYLVILPFLLLILNDFLKKKALTRFVFEFVFVLLAFSFLIAIADIPYYNKFYNRLTIASFEWFKNFKTLAGMVFQDPKLWLFFIPLILILWLSRKLLRRIFQTENNNSKTKKWYYLVTLILIFLGLRGTVDEAPLRYRNAFDGQSIFLNTLKLNPLFTIEKSYEEKIKHQNSKLNLIDTQVAIKNIRSYFSADSTYKSPVARFAKNSIDSIAKKKNVVLIIMESMGAAKMKYFGNTENRTPFLDSIFLKGISFTNLYSNGIHTYAGVFGTNYSFPMIFGKHPMTDVIPKKYNGLPYTLAENGYQNSFFIAGDGSFDNMMTFLLDNHYKKVYTGANYPKKEYQNVYGVSDDYLLNYALKTIHNRTDKTQPFLATILTISDHSPFGFPSYYKSDTKDQYVKGTQFADWSLNRFMKKAAKEPWFDNTVFVFIADHGQVQWINYKTPLTYNHTPLIFWYKGIKPQIIDKMASQLDVYPTLMDLLHIDYVNNSFGIDLFKEDRPYTLFNHDKEYGVIDKEFLLIVDENQTLGLYKYQNQDKTNYLDKYPEVRKKMETYYKSQIQAYHYMLKSDLQLVK